MNKVAKAKTCVVGRGSMREMELRDTNCTVVDERPYLGNTRPFKIEGRKSC
jgi:hypothetical protein